MENNQEHKIDKIFKNLLDNQSITPPADAWMAVHTYTIGQEESKKKGWLRYASLALLVLLLSGLGLWYFIDNQSVVNSNKSPLLSHKLFVENTNNRININSKISILKSSKKILKSCNQTNPNSDNCLHELLVENTNNRKMLLSHEVDWSGDQPRGEDDADSILNPASVEKFTYSNDNIISPNIERQIEKIKSKSLILNNLSDKMQKESIKKIVGLEEGLIDKEQISEDDSTVYGKKFSLKHPIITLGTGIVWNDWTVKTNDYNTYTPSFNSGISKTSFIRLGVTWKVNKKSRLGFNIGLYNSGSFAMGWRGPITSSGFNFPQIIFDSDNSNPSYIAETPFGNVKIPIKTLSDNGFNIDASNPPKVIQVAYGGDLHSLTYTQGEISLENDLLNRKKRNEYSYQIYLVSNLTFQRQISYNYWARDILISSSSSAIVLPNKIFITENHLENGADIIWGIKYGFGFRWQFAKKWNFNIEGVMQNNLNSWVKNQPYTTNQKSYSIQTGIQLNL